ncbi:MAG: tellurite resistance TerB family protein [Cyanobacteriota bacterium]
MGLFDRVRTSQQTQLSLGPAEAFAAITLIVIASDGYLADAELDLLYTVLNRMQLFRSYSADVMRRMFDKLSGILKRDGYEALFSAAVATLPHDLYDTAFAIATDLVLSDGHVSEEEEGLLQSLANALELPGDTVHKIIDVMIIKNKG